MDWLSTSAFWIGYASLGAAAVAVSGFLGYVCADEWRKLRSDRIAELEAELREAREALAASTVIERAFAQRIAELEAAAKARETQLAEMRERIKAIDDEGIVMMQVAQVLAMMGDYDFPLPAPLLGHDDGAPLPEPRA